VSILPPDSIGPTLARTKTCSCDLYVSGCPFKRLPAGFTDPFNFGFRHNSGTLGMALILQ